jgi:hypothetical protein
MLPNRRSKALFVQYNDEDFMDKTTRPGYYGLLGPLIGAEVGDIVEVVLKVGCWRALCLCLNSAHSTSPLTLCWSFLRIAQNKLEFPVNFSPDGGLVPLHDTMDGKEVAPWKTFTYRFLVPKESGPLDGELSTVPVLYFSDVDFVGHTNAGLFGLVVISNRGGLRADGITPKDIDMLLPLHFQV